MFTLTDFTSSGSGLTQTIQKNAGIIVLGNLGQLNGQISSYVTYDITCNGIDDYIEGWNRVTDGSAQPVDLLANRCMLSIEYRG